MSKETIERCDCCGTQVPRLGSRGDDEGSYRAVFRRERWTFSPRTFGWGMAAKGMQKEIDKLLRLIAKFEGRG